MNITLISGLIIFGVLAVTLLMGIPISVALATASILAILPTLDINVALLTALSGFLQEFHPFLF